MSFETAKEPIDPSVYCPVCHADVLNLYREEEYTHEIGEKVLFVEVIGCECGYIFERAN